MRRNFYRDARIHLACSDDEAKPSLHHVFFRNNYAIATDSCILVKCDITQISNGFKEEEINILNGKSLHKDKFNIILKYEYIFISEDGIKCIPKGDNPEIFLEFDKNDEIKYPNVEGVIKKTYDKCHADTPGVKEIGFTGDILEKLNKAMPGSNELCFKFSNERNAIYITSDVEEYNNCIGLITPRILRKNEYE